MIGDPVEQRLEVLPARTCIPQEATDGILDETDI
jgi:hypothetical protein